jgi:hypothetical protein
MRIPDPGLNLMRIHPDSDPKHCFVASREQSCGSASPGPGQAFLPSKEQRYEFGSLGTQKIFLDSREVRHGSGDLWP